MKPTSVRLTDAQLAVINALAARGGISRNKALQLLLEEVGEHLSAAKDIDLICRAWRRVVALRAQGHHDAAAVVELLRIIAVVDGGGDNKPKTPA